MNIKLIKIKRQASLLLRLILKPKTLLLITVALLLADYILFRILGDNYEEKSAPLNTIFLVGEIYITLGFTALAVAKLKNVKWYKSVTLLFGLSVVSLLIYLRFTEPYGDLRTPVSIISFVVLAAFLAAIFLVIKHIIGHFTHSSKDKFTLRQLKYNDNGVSFRRKLNRQNITLAVRFLTFTVLLIGLVYAVNRINTLDSKLAKIETKLGGPTKIGCNEKDSIDKVRQSVVRIVGGEGEGSGFAIKDGGIILTNFHVIEFEPSPKVILPDNSFETAEILMADKNVDLAIIKINKNLPVISWGDPLSILNPLRHSFSEASRLEEFFKLFLQDGLNSEFAYAFGLKDA